MKDNALIVMMTLGIAFAIALSIVALERGHSPRYQKPASWDMPLHDLKLTAQGYAKMIDQWQSWGVGHERICDRLGPGLNQLVPKLLTSGGYSTNLSARFATIQNDPRGWSNFAAAIRESAEELK